MKVLIHRPFHAVISYYSYQSTMAVGVMVKTVFSTTGKGYLRILSQPYCFHTEENTYMRSNSVVQIRITGKMSRENSSVHSQV